jgi:hypothetical protein
VKEHVDVVLRALGEILDADVRARLRRALPEALARQLEVPEHGEPPPYGPPRSAPPHTLASGRPGSRHPLSEGAPSRGHEHSVARNSDPHAETKLSSAHGLTQERFGESLATYDGRPKRES